MALGCGWHGKASSEGGLPPRGWAFLITPALTLRYRCSPFPPFPCTLRGLRSNSVLGHSLGLSFNTDEQPVVEGRWAQGGASLPHCPSAARCWRAGPQGCSLTWFSQQDPCAKTPFAPWLQLLSVSVPPQMGFLHRSVARLILFWFSHSGWRLTRSVSFTPAQPQPGTDFG